MAYYVNNKNNLPFYTDGKHSFACTLSASEVVVDWNSKEELDKTNVKSFMNEAEIKHYYGIKLVDAWDRNKQAVKKVSNKKVSSIQKANKE